VATVRWECYWIDWFVRMELKFRRETSFLPPDFRSSSGGTKGPAEEEDKPKLYAY